MIDVAYAQEAAGQAAGAAGQAAQGGGSVIGAFFPFILIMVLFYFLMVVPQNKEKKKREAMLGALKPGDRILTQGGVWGTVANVNTEKDLVVLKIAENVKVEVARSYVAMVQVPETEPKK